ncbi:hypothetical protein IMY05_C1355000200 [Salix suchowensis]|nr:hypothetical protein IMY05_C1355000200 [Salix suchowensis]
MLSRMIFLDEITERLKLIFGLHGAPIRVAIGDTARLSLPISITIEMITR